MGILGSVQVGVPLLRGAPAVTERRRRGGERLCDRGGREGRGPGRGGGLPIHSTVHREAQQRAQHAAVRRGRPRAEIPAACCQQLGGLLAAAREVPRREDRGRAHFGGGEPHPVPADADRGCRVPVRPHKIVHLLHLEHPRRLPRADFQAVRDLQDLHLAQEAAS